MRRPQPLAAWPLEARRRIAGVLTDIDDTLTTDGRITAEAMRALAHLRDAGLAIIAITGRPMGWSEPIARDTPLDAVVAENGAVALFREGGVLRVEYVQDESTRERNGQRLRLVAQRILRQIPGTALARDSAGRVTDIAIDHGEFSHLSQESIARVVALMRAEGMNATVSSIHINGWYGEHDKPSGARWIVQRLLGRDLDAETGRWVYVGDSPNDQAMFQRFAHSVGVANLCRFAGELKVWPAYLTQAERGAGFAELSAALLERVL